MNPKPPMRIYNEVRGGASASGTTGEVDTVRRYRWQTA
jgi:hypothetical protein